MLLSRKFVSDYIDLPEELTIEQIAEDMTSVGNEYDSASSLINCTNLIVGEVLECVMHPDSDHLHCCKVNVGEEVLDIVSIYLGISESEVSELEIELNQDKNLYEICFHVNDQSYYFEVHSMTGTILNSNN